MKATPEELSALQEMQSFDLEIIKLAKEFDAIPERDTLKKLQAKRSAIKEKADQIDGLRSKVESQLSRFDVENFHLEEKAKRIQETIESVQDDFRAVQSHTKDLDGVMNRKESVDFELESLHAEMDKIEKLQNQVAAGLESLEKEISSHRASLSEKEADLKAKLEDAKEKRAAEAANISSDLLKRYEKIARGAGGVAIGELEGDRCGVCRSAIESGRLIELKSQAPLGICPACKRLLIIK